MARLVPSEVVRVIDQLFPYAADPKEPEERLSILVNGRVSALISLIDRLPSELVPQSPSAFADYITQLEILRVKNATATGIGIPADRPLAYHYSAEPVWLLRKHLAVCPDESAADTEHELLFINEPQLRNVLRVDLTEAYDSLYAGRFKAATVLAGAIIEALLVWRISKLTNDELATAIGKVPSSKRPAKGTTVEKMYFAQLIEVAAAAPIISVTTAEQIRLAKDFRNLIHPGASIRTGEHCGKDTALATLAGVECVIGQFQ